jgi:hypothetical protein
MVSPPAVNPARMFEAVNRFRVTSWVHWPFGPPGWKPAAAYWALR